MTKGKPINMVLLGPPGAGKGTQAALLVKAYDLLHVSTGDMLRAAISEGTETGLKAQEYMTKGELVPDELVTQIVVERIRKPDAEGGVIFDGYPRTKAQAASLDEAFSKEGRELDIVLYLKTSEEVAVQRLSGRRMCPKCLKNYHITNMPPKEEGVCDTCKVELLQREDDKPETVKNRLRVYVKQTEDLIGYYEDKGLLREVSGDVTADKLFEEIDALFKKEGLIDDDSEKQK